MPIYEYNCEKCGQDFELLINADSMVSCSSCGSKEVKRKLSLFAVNTSASAAPECAHGCPGGFENGKCGSGMCGAQ